MLAMAGNTMSSCPIKADKMRSLLASYRHAVDSAAAVHVANGLADIINDYALTACREQPGQRREWSFDEALAFIDMIRQQAGRDPRVHERAAKRIKDELVVANRGLIRIVAKNVLGLAAKNPENLVEAEQEGAMGVMRAVDAFDPARGLWSICARHWIRYYVQTCAHRQCDFPRQRHQRMPPEVAKQANTIRARLGREPLHAELVCKGAPVTLEQWRGWTERAQMYSFEMSEPSQNADHAGNQDRGNLIADEKTSPELAIATADFSKRLKACIAEMSPRNRAIMNALFVEGETILEVVERFGIAKQRVHEIKHLLADRLKLVLTS